MPSRPERRQRWWREFQRTSPAESARLEGETTQAWRARMIPLLEAKWKERRASKGRTLLGGG
jgi:hypothetical protein